MENVLDSYNKALEENHSNVIFYQGYIESYEKLITNLSTFRDTLEAEVLVPVCNRILMKGNLIHTNQVTVSLGCGYFTKCSVTNAQEICKRRIKKAHDILINLEKEKEYLENQMKFRQEYVFSENLKEIIEPYDEATEREWRKQHTVKIREHRKEENISHQSQSHQDIVQKLELLELQEDIDRLYSNQNILNNQIKEPILNKNEYEHVTCVSEEIEQVAEDVKSGVVVEESRELVLRKKLAELRQRKKGKCSTEEDIFRRLDELQEEEEIEDELDRLYESIYGNNEHIPQEDESDEESDSTDDNSTSSNRRVSFPKSDVEIHTVNIYFKHSDYSDPQEKYNSENKDITSPSDVYKLFPENSKNNQRKGIIKNCHKVKDESRNESLLNQTNNEEEAKTSVNYSATVSVGNVLQHQDALQLQTQVTVDTKRPVSKFKSMRMSSKKKNTEN